MNNKKCSPVSCYLAPECKDKGRNKTCPKSTPDSRPYCRPYFLVKREHSELCRPMKNLFPDKWHKSVSLCSEKVTKK